MTLTGDWNIGNVDDLRRLLAGCLDSGKEIVLDLSGVEGCDTAALQLVWSMRRTALQRGVGFRVAEVSRAMAEIAGSLGLSIEELNGV
jgi:anti-anti-sigma factor